jgi:hypothetical protein
MGQPRRQHDHVLHVAWGRHPGPSPAPPSEGRFARSLSVPRGTPRFAMHEASPHPMEHGDNHRPGE